MRLPRILSSAISPRRAAPRHIPRSATPAALALQTEGGISMVRQQRGASCRHVARWQVGIDLGTTYSVIGVYHAGSVRLVLGSWGNPVRGAGRNKKR